MIKNKRETFQNKLDICFRRYKDNRAVEYAGKIFTYEEINRTSGRIACRLRREGTTQETIIGIWTGDRVLFICAMIAVLKAGGIFVPFDKANPMERLEKMMKIAGVKAVFIDKAVQADPAALKLLKKQNILPLVIDEFMLNDIHPGFEDLPPVQYSPEDKVYIYFTSGTTGEPCGVLGKNKSLLHYIEWEVETFKVTEDYRLSQFAPPGFDAFLKEVFVAFFSGAALCIPETLENILDSRQLSRWLEEARINMLHCVPGIFRLLNSPQLTWNSLPNLAYILMSGEKLPPPELEEWYPKMGERIQLVNLYGTTETTILSTYYLVGRSDAERNIVPVGKPKKGVRFIILDQKMNICKKGMVGEIYIRTPYRTFGYYNAPVLNKERFIRNPFNDDPNDIIFKTGDLARLLPDDNIELLGRIDRQIKMRGFRVELEEIERVMSKYPLLKEAVVIKKEISAANEFLCAYITAKETNTISNEVLIARVREYLTEKLPAYMIPAQILKIEKIPRKPNGKVDYDAFANLFPDQKNRHTAPRDPMTKNIREIWSHLLKLKRQDIGVNVSFFELGGNSLSTLSLIAEIHETYDIRITLGDVFKNTTIEKLVELIKKSSKDKYNPIEPVEMQSGYPLSSAQKRLYIMQRMEKNSTGYNVPAMVLLEGKLAKKKLEETLGKLIKRHESFRTSFEIIEEEVVQKIHRHVDFKMEYFETGIKKESPSAVNEIIKVFFRPFDLAEAALLRIGLIKIKEEKHMLVADMHHIITDGKSMEIFVRDFMSIYAGKDLPGLRVQYKDFSQWQNSDREKQQMLKQEKFWLTEFIEAIPVLNLPTDFTRPAIQSFEGDSVDFILDEAETKVLKDISRRSAVTLYMILLSIYNVLLYKLSGQEDIVVGTPVAGRKHPDTEEIIGMFVNTLALKYNIPAEKTFNDFLQGVKEKTLLSFENQDYPFETLLDKLEINRDASRNSLFDVVFALQNTALRETQIKGLKIIPCAYKSKKARFDLTLTAVDLGTTLSFVIEYSTKLFKKETIRRFFRFYKKIVSEILEKPGQKIAQLEIIANQEKNRVLYEFNDTAAEFPAGKTIHRLIEEQARKNPGCIAAVCEDRQITYKELDLVSNRLARLLRKKGITNDSLVGIMCDRGIEMLTGILGIWKAGGAYIPLDIDSPPDRLKKIFSESQMNVLLSQKKLYPDSAKFYNTICGFAKIEHIIYLDRVNRLEYEKQLFGTFKIVALLTEGKEARLPGENLFRYENQVLSYRDCMETVEQLIRFAGNPRIQPVLPTAVILANPIYKIITLLTLKRLNIPFIRVEPGTPKNELEQRVRDSSITTIFTETAFLDELDRMLWESKVFKNYILLDEYEYKGGAKESRVKDIYNHFGRESIESVNDYGWQNSYDGAAFTIEEMNEYIDNFKTKLKPYLTKNSRVLEVGCGHGLVLFEIAPRVGRYIATDLAPVVLKNVKRRVQREGLQNVELIAAAASAVKDLEEKEIDIVICSAVVHYFPHSLYLETFIKNAIDLLKGQGIIYLDDLLNLRKKQALVDSAREYKELNPGAPSKIDWDGDLFIDIDFFHDLQQKYPEIIQWESSNKLGRIQNELTKFRYDVILKINKKNIKNSRLKPLKKNRITLDEIKKCSTHPPLTPPPPPGVSNEIHKENNWQVNINIGEVNDIGTVESYPGKSLRRLNKPADLAYVIYTSGSTGVPKGVMVEHIGMMNHVHGKINDLQITAKSIVAQNASHVFDISVWQFFTALTQGGRTVIYTRDVVLNPDQFIDCLRKESITVLEVVPSYLHVILDSMGPGYKAHLPLDYLLVTGETVKPGLVTRWFETYPDIKMINAYGPTEASDDITHYIMDKAPGKQQISIGRPLQNLHIYIVDRNMNLCPVGVKGEICVSGIGVGRGYLNDGGQTGEVFMQDPFFEEKGRRLYKTGDLGCWNPDGTCEFFGRKDYQVKIRGFRIELGEIENKILEYPHIKDVVVIAKEIPAGGHTFEPGNKYLCAYLVAHQKIDISHLRDILTRDLPDYMIPAFFVRIEKIPLTKNGKIDHRALPVPETKIGKECTYPRNEVEKIIAALWGEVLNLEKDNPGIDDNFFQCGGHSLKATILISKIHNKLNVSVPLGEFFKNSTIRGLGEYIKRAAEDRYVSIEPAEKKDYHLLTSAQKRLYILQQMDSAATAYNIPQTVILQGKLLEEELENIFKKLGERHESLRTSFEIIDGQPMQRIHENFDFEIEYFDFKRQFHTPHSTLHVNTIKDFIRPFDLSQAPLIRVGLIKIEEAEHILMVDMHHIISDGVSMGVLIKEFMSFYAGEELANLKIHYKDFSEWQNSKEMRALRKQQEKYWVKEFEDDIPVLNLPTDFAREAIQSFEGSTFEFELDKESARPLKKYFLEEGTTIFMVLLTVYNIFLSKISSQEDFVVGIPTAGRRHSDLEQTVGMFVNTLALRNFPEGRKNFKQLLEEIKNRTLEAFANQDYQYEELVEKVAVTRDIGHNPLFDTMFILQNIGIPEVEIPGLKLKPYKIDSDISKFDLTLQCIEIEETLWCTFEYSTKLFKRTTIERFINYFRRIIPVVSHNPAVKIAEIEIISKDEKNQVLYEFNDTSSDYPRGKTIHQLYEEQTNRTPDNIVLVGIGNRDGRSTHPIIVNMHITSRELNQRSNQLAHLLRTKMLKPDNIVGIMAQSSPEFIVGLLAILKAGGACMPIDPRNPRERINSLLKDANAKLLLSSLSSLHQSVDMAIDCIHLNNQENDPGEKNTAPKNINTPTSLAYIIYSSGTSGVPKGSLITHRNIIRLMKNQDYVDIREDERILQFVNYMFDVSIFDVFAPLLNGACVVLMNKNRVMEPGFLVGVFLRNQISMMFLPTPMFNMLVDIDIHSLKNMRKILVGGEALSFVHTKRAVDELGAGKIINAYGPSENTVYTTTYTFDKLEGTTVLIGKPIANTQVVVLDKHRKPVPVGVVGELCAAGDGVARGYLNRPELTHEKFIQNPHVPGNRLYRVGDLARWLPDGNLEYLGRMDHQVKIRGFRIEPGEIESLLKYHPSVKEALVIDREDESGSKYLCAYITTHEKIGTPDLKNILSGKLPDYMIPSYFIQLEQLPMTSNGKVDRKALPEPDRAGSQYTAPRNETEEKLTAIWSTILHIDKEIIGIDANFFELGGHSLKAINLTSRIHREFNVRILLDEIFTKSSIRRLGEFITKAIENRFSPIVPAEKKEFYELSSAQKRLYILQQMEIVSTAYNIPQVVILQGNLEKEKAKNSFRKLIRRHESMRTSFHIVNDEPVQRINETVEFEIDYYDMKGVEAKVDEEPSSVLEGTRGLTPLPIEPADLRLETAADLINLFIRPFDLSRAPLMRAGLVKLPHTPTALHGHPSQEGREDKYLLMVDMHHIITDGISQGIWEKEFITLPHDRKLPPLKLQYKDYSEWQNRDEQKQSLEQQEKYWLKTYQGEIPVLNLPIDNVRPSVQSFEGSESYFLLDSGQTKKLRALALEMGVTLYMVILAFYYVLLAKISGQEDIVVGTPVSGRNHSDLEPIIGMFVNTLALRNYPSPGKTFAQLLEEVKQRTLEALDNQDYPFEDLVEKLGVRRDTGRNPIFDVMFAYQTQQEQRLKIRENMEVKIEPYEYENRTSKFDMVLNAVEEEHALHCNIEYSTKLFKKKTIQRFAAYFKDIVTSVSNNRNVKLKDIEISLELADSKSTISHEAQGAFGF